MLSLYAKIFLVCLFFGTSATQRNEPEKVVTPHQVTQYDKAGPYSIGNTLTFAERNQLLSRVRSFLWDHWSQRRPGQLQVTVYTVEGDPTTYVFFTEKDSKDRWCIRSKSESVIAKLLKPAKHRDSKRRKSYTTKSSDLTRRRVKLFQAVKNGSRIPINFDLKATRDPRISSGEVKGGWPGRKSLDDFGCPVLGFGGRGFFIGSA